MTLKASFAQKPAAKTDTLVFLIAKDRKLPAPAAKLDGLAEALKNNEDFKGEKEQIFSIPLSQKSGAARAILLGLGDQKSFNSTAAEMLGGKLAATLGGTGAQKIAVYAPADAVLAAHMAAGLELRSYSFDKYKTGKKGKKDSKKSVAFILDKSTEAAKTYKILEAENAGVFLARDLVNEPANVIYPDSYAKIIAKELKPLGVIVDILDEKKMKQLGFGAHLAVGQGSDKPPRVVIMRWMGKGAQSKDKPLALVGKGVTFDTGGYSIKPAGGMEDMVMDMGGSAAVVGTMKALALSKAKANVVGIVGLAENMISGNAYRPGDIITSLSGKTIEVYNTDAEGRLVLCDALTYVQQKYKPSAVIDLATLTGAIMVALGYEYAGVFATSDQLWNRLDSASKDSGEKIWRMPLDEVYKKAMEGNVADLNNMGNMARYGGACTAAGFLQHFIEDGMDWAHIDIAGTAWNKSAKGVQTKGGSGYGVRLLHRMITSR
jgi:leucyl aminopeptidase